MKLRELSSLRQLLTGLLILLVILCPACNEPHIVLSVDNQRPPQFKFDGTGYIPFFVVLEVGADNQTADTSGNFRVMWDIRPLGPEEGRVPLPPITYGIVPPGFVQRVPTDGNPPPLEEGKIYQAGGPPVEMPKGFLRFTVKNGRIIQTMN